MGEGEAASLAALNAIACLRKGVCMQPLPDAWQLAGFIDRIIWVTFFENTRNEVLTKTRRVFFLKK